MGPEEIIDRKLFLKRQALSIIRQDISDLEWRKALMRRKREMEREIKQEFDPVLSRQLDALSVLLGDG